MQLKKNKWKLILSLKLPILFSLFSFYKVNINKKNVNLDFHQNYFQSEIKDKRAPDSIKDVLSSVKSILEPKNLKTFHSNIKDITSLNRAKNGAIILSKDMAKFYIAVAAVESYECFKRKDPIACEEYFESLKDPSSHLGFSLFIWASHGASKGMTHVTQKMVQGNLSPKIKKFFLKRLIDKKGNPIEPGWSPRMLNVIAQGQLAMMAGFLADHSFSTSFHNKYFVELRQLMKASRDPKRWEKRKIVLNKLWRELLSKEMLSSLTPDALSLSASALSSAASQGLIKVIASATLQKLGSKIESLKLVQNAQNSSILLKFKNGKSKLLKVKGVSWSFKKTKVVGKGLWQFILLEGGTILFLKYNHFFDPLIRLWWDSKKPIEELAIAQNKLEKSIENKSNFEIVKNDTVELMKKWKVLRSLFSFQVEMNLERHKNKINNFQQELYKIKKYYSWIFQGLDFKSTFWKNNEENWHIQGVETMPSSYLILGKELSKMINGFFCGDEFSSKNITTPKFWGNTKAPIPLKHKLKINTFRAYDKKNICNNEYLLKKYENDFSEFKKNIYPNKLKHNFFEEWLHGALGNYKEAFILFAKIKEARKLISILQDDYDKAFDLEEKANSNLKELYFQMVEIKLNLYKDMYFTFQRDMTQALFGVKRIVKQDYDRFEIIENRRISEDTFDFEWVKHGLKQRSFEHKINKKNYIYKVGILWSLQQEQVFYQDLSKRTETINPLISEFLLNQSFHAQKEYFNYKKYYNETLKGPLDQTEDDLEGRSVQEESEQNSESTVSNENNNFEVKPNKENIALDIEGDKVFVTGEITLGTLLTLHSYHRFRGELKISRLLKTSQTLSSLCYGKEKSKKSIMKQISSQKHQNIVQRYTGKALRIITPGPLIEGVAGVFLIYHGANSYFVDEKGKMVEVNLEQL